MQLVWSAPLWPSMPRWAQRSRRALLGFTWTRCYRATSSGRSCGAEAVIELTGQVALVTGAGSAEGIGFACARQLSRCGARVALVSTTDRIHRRVAELGVDAFGLV